MKKVLFAFALMSVILTSCGEKKSKTVVLDPVPEPTFYQNDTYFNEKNGMYVELPLYKDNIVMVGDDYIDRGLWAEFYADTTIKNRGITYDCTQHVLWRIDQIAAAHPAKIFVEVGYNDVKQGFDKQTTIENIGKIFDRAKALSPATKLYYMSIVSRNKDTEEQKALAAEINTEIEKLSDNGVFEYIDVRPMVAGGIVEGKYSFNDGEHLNGAGYAALAQAIERQIGKQHLNTPNDKKDAKKFFPYYDNRASIFRSLPRAEGKIMMLGNSLNNNACWNELFPFISLVNRGISGDTINGIAERLDDVVSNQPSKIFLQTGCNDMYGKDKVDVAKVWSDYEKLIKEIKSQMPGIHLYVQSIFPVGKKAKNAEVFNAAANEVNKLLEAGGSRYGYFYMDIASLLSDDNGYLRDDLTYDGIHLGADGYFIWAAELAKGNRLMGLKYRELTNN